MTKMVLVQESELKQMIREIIREEYKAVRDEDITKRAIEKINGKRDYYTCTELARLTEVTPSTIYRWAKDGKLKFFLRGTRMVYPKSQLKIANELSQ